MTKYGKEQGLDLETEPLRVCRANLHYQLLVPTVVKKPAVCLKRPAGGGCGRRESNVQPSESTSVGPLKKRGKLGSR